MDTVKLLQALTKIPVVSGFEMKSGIHQELMKLLSKYNPTVDSMGNVVVKIGSGKKNILVEAHMDEVQQLLFSHAHVCHQGQFDKLVYDI